MKRYPAIIKWSGSKRTVAPKLATLFPDFDRYFEPFVGSGAMIPYSNNRPGFCGDIIPELIDLWNAIKENPNEVAYNYKIRWDRLQNEGYQVYYEIRDAFNENRGYNDLLFLTRTCVNGLIRFNSRGEFNNSLHYSRPGIAPVKLEKYLIEWSSYIQHIQFRCQDYRDTLRDARDGDFVFLDPPYGGTKGRYTVNEFNLEEFFTTLQNLNEKGVRWLLTFDGKSGKRMYNYAPPENLYRHKLSIYTGNSTFRKIEDKTIEKVEESVYFNYEVPHVLFDGF